MNILHSKKGITPRDFFLAIGAAVALYVWSFAFLLLAFAIIDELIPDVVYGGNPGSVMAGAVGVLIVVVPLYSWLMRMSRLDIECEPERREQWVRRWSIGFTLFVSAIVFAISLIRVVVVFVSGALTLPTILKMCIMLLFAGVIFYFYKRLYRGDLSSKTQKFFETGVIVDAVIIIVVAFAIFGGPATQRAMRLDEERVNDLQSIQYQIVEYYQNNNALPEHLVEIETALRGFEIPTDPETNESYNYQIHPDTLTFELCATFSRAYESKNPKIEYYSSYGITEGNRFWDHDEGYYCFERTIDPKLLSDSPKIIR